MQAWTVGLLGAILGACSAIDVSGSGDASSATPSSIESPSERETEENAMAATGGYRNILVGVDLPPEGVKLGTTATFTVISQNPPQPGVTYGWRLVDQTGKVYESGQARLGADGTRRWNAVFVDGDPVGSWGLQVFFLGGLYNDGDGISFPVVPAEP